MIKSTVRLKALSRRLRSEQAAIIHAVAELEVFPARSVIERISMLENAIVAVDSLTSDDPPESSPMVPAGT